MAHQPDLHLQDGGKWLPVKYSIFTGRGAGSEGIDASFSHGTGNSAVLVIQVYWADVKDAIYNLCGFNQWDLNTNWLNRTLPKRHPFFDHLSVSKIVSVKPMVLTGKESHPPGPYPAWTHALITVAFDQKHYPVLNDATLDNLFAPVSAEGGIMVRQEWARWVEWTPDIGTETQVVEKGAMIYVEGAGGDEPVAGQTISQVPLGKTMSKGNILGIWRHVPYRGLVSETTLRPENLIAAAGTVNIAAFMNYPAGTLRFDGYKYLTFNESPYPESWLGGGLGAGNQGDNQLWPSLSVDVQLIFSYFDPPHAHSNYRGHNLAPFRGAPDGSWYLVSETNNANGNRIIAPYDHRLMFRRAVSAS